MTACCGPIDGFETVPGAIRPERGGPGVAVGAGAVEDPAPNAGGSGPIWPGVVLKKVAPAYLSRPAAAPTRRKTAE